MPIIGMTPAEILRALMAHHFVWAKIQKRVPVEQAVAEECPRLSMYFSELYWNYQKGGDLTRDYELLISDPFHGDGRAARISLEERGADQMMMRLTEEKRERWAAAPMSSGHVHYRLYGFKERTPSRTLRRTK